MMPDDDSGFPELWDEYQWERFLQQQDRKTEQYFRLFEKYMDHPNRDELIAREMGWSVDSDEAGGAWAEPEEIEEFDEIDVEAHNSAEQEGEEEPEDPFDELQTSELYIQSMELNRRVFALLQERAEVKDHPVAVEMAARVAVCGAKIAAALCGDDFSEVGMTIAYLKRGLKAANDALGSCFRLVEEEALSRRDAAAITEMLFPIREALVDMMGEYRQELRRRRGEA